MRCTARRRADGDHRAAHRARSSPAPITRPSRCVASKPTPSSKTHDYFQSIWAEDMHACRASCGTRRCASARRSPPISSPRSSVRHGARGHLQAGRRGRLGDRPRIARRLRRLAVPLHAVRERPDGDRPRSPLVYFGSFQDLLGRDNAGNIKAKNEWLHAINWDLVIFDEYHFGAWRDTAKELFEGEDDAVAKKETKLEYAAVLDVVNEDLDELSGEETDFLPITTRAYLYLSGTPFKALATGEFIEEQIFNWTYTDEQRAKEEFAAKNPDKLEPVRRAPGDAPAHLPDARRADRDRQSGRVRRVRPQRVLRRDGHGATAPSSSTRTTCRSGSTSSVARTPRPRSTT